MRLDSDRNIVYAIKATRVSALKESKKIYLIQERASEDTGAALLVKCSAYKESSMYSSLLDVRATETAEKIKPVRFEVGSEYVTQDYHVEAP